MLKRTPSNSRLSRELTSARRTLLMLSIFIFSLSTARAQTPTRARPSEETQPTIAPSTIVLVTATASAGRVGYVSMGEVNHTRLQVFSAQGSQVYDSNYRLGNVIDWQLRDHQGTALPDGTYLFLVTVKDFSGNLTQKYGTATLDQGQVYLEQTQRAELSSSLATALEGNQLSETLSPVDRIGAAGLNRTTSTASAASTPTTVGTSAAVTPDSDAAGGGKELAAAAATQDRIAKWIDNSGNLGDSIITESGGNIGIGTDTPTQRLQVATGNLQLGSGAGSHSMLLNYSSFGGGDITAMMNGVEMLSFGFNNTGRLGGTPNNAGGRLLYFYDRQAAAYRGGFNGVGEWYWGPSVNRYGLKVAQPNAGVTGVSVDADGNVGIGTTAPLMKLDVNGGGRFTPGGSGGAIQFGTPSTETGMSIGGNGTARADLRFNGSTLKLVAGPAGGPPVDTSGIVVNTSGLVGIGTSNPQGARLQVVGGTGTAVRGESTDSLGVYAVNPSGFALGVEGNAVQNRDHGGLIKAMIYVDPYLSEDENVVRCFNSQAGVNAAATRPCGFNVYRTGQGFYLVNFGFDVSSRFYSLTLRTDSHVEIAGTITPGPTVNQLSVLTFKSQGSGSNHSASYRDAGFWLIVY